MENPNVPTTLGLNDGESRPDGGSAGGLANSRALSASLTLTQAEIRDLAKFCGMIVQDPTPQEAEDEKETEVTITPWPAHWPPEGILDDEGFLVESSKHIAHLTEYPEEGFMPLGEPNVQGHESPPK